MKLLIANGYLIDPAQGINTGRNLLIEDGRVVGLLDRGEQHPEVSKLIDATGFDCRPGIHRYAHASARARR